MTVVVAIAVAIASSALALRVGYRKGIEEAQGEIRQSFQTAISQVRNEKKRV